MGVVLALWAWLNDEWAWFNMNGRGFGDMGVA